MSKPSDQQVTAGAILRSVLELQRQGHDPAMEHLEQVEPDLAGYLMENLSLLHQALLGLGAAPKKTRRVYRLVQTLALVCVTSLRKAHFELWEEQTGARLEVLDPAGGDAASPDASPDAASPGGPDVSPGP